MLEILSAEQADDLLAAKYRGWLSDYWSDVCLTIPTRSLNEKKALFFELLKTMLDTGRIRFEHPTGKHGDLWEENSTNIIQHLLAGWPVEATSEQSELIFDYFYIDLTRCPPVHWLCEDGTWLGS